MSHLDEETLVKMVEYKDAILGAESGLRRSLEENLEKHHLIITQETLLTAIRIPLASEIANDEELEGLSYDFANVLLSFDSEDVRRLQNLDAPKPLVDMLIELSTAYQFEIQKIIWRREQGDNAWINVTSHDIRHDDSGLIGMNHKVTLLDGNTVDISTNLTSNLQLIIHLLYRQNRLIQGNTEVAREQMSDQVVEQFAEQAQLFRDLTKYDDNSQ